MFNLEKRTNYFYAKVTDKLSHNDYVINIIPELESALADETTPNKFVLNMIEFKGWSELTAMYDDMKLGLKHRKDFGKIALVGDKYWEEVITKFTNLMMKAEMKFFYNESDAIKWIQDN